MKTRIYFLDNLRTFLIFLVVVIHSGLVYEAVLENTWIVIDPNGSCHIIRVGGRLCESRYRIEGKDKKEHKLKFGQ